MFRIHLGYSMSLYFYCSDQYIAEKDIYLSKAVGLKGPGDSVYTPDSITQS